MEETAFIPPPLFVYIAVFLWATSGALVGRSKNFDIIGVFVVAVLSAFGGGILRDGLFLQRVPVLLTEAIYLEIILGAVLLVTIIGRRIQTDRTLAKLVSIIDAIGVPMFVILGVEMALDAGLDILPATLVGTISGVGGGLLRDILAGDIPELLRPGQYNTLFVIAAGLLYFSLTRLLAVPIGAAAWFTITLFFVVRLLTIRYNWRTKPVNEFEMLDLVERITDHIPLWRSEKQPGRGQTNPEPAPIHTSAANADEEKGE